MWIILLPPAAIVIVILWGMSVWAGLLKKRREEPESVYRPGCSFIAAQCGLAGLLGGAFGLLWELQMREMSIVGAFNVSLLAMLVSLPAHAVVVGICRNGDIKKCVRSAFIGALVAAAVASSFWAWSKHPSRIIRMIREDLQLAELPASAADVKANAWSFGFGSAGYMMFKASAQDIGAFIASSASLQGVEPYVPGTAHTETTEQEDLEYAMRKIAYEQLQGDRSAPRWFDPNIDGKGRVYEIEGEHWGFVVVNEATGTVYIMVAWG